MVFFDNIELSGVIGWVTLNISIKLSIFLNVAHNFEPKSSKLPKKLYLCAD